MTQRLLYIGHVWPEPRSSAAGERSLSLMRAFAAGGWHTTFASAAEPGERAEGVTEVADETVSILLNDDSFDAFVSACRPDVVIFDRFMIEEQFGWRVERQCPRALRVIDTVDLHCLRRARQAAIANDTQALDLLLGGDDAKREIAAILRSDLSLIISSYEMELLQERFSLDEELLQHLPFMIEAAVLGLPSPVFEKRRHFATIGNFLHAPNEDAFDWLHRDVWPRVRRLLPDSQLHVYGSYTPDRALALDDPRSGFRVLGWADDARAALARARVCLAPLRFGAGLKGKLADAMVAGTPIVTTSIGAESMAFEAEPPAGLGWCGAAADTPQAIAEAAVELHENSSAWQAAQRRGRQIVASEF
jgi:glycosyltransferase involved in cell wall biosynthesis